MSGSRAPVRASRRDRSAAQALDADLRAGCYLPKGTDPARATRVLWSRTGPRGSHSCRESPYYAKAADGIRDARAFSEPERWQIDWERAYTRDEWLEVMATDGGFNRLERSQLDAPLADASAVIDATGGSVTVKCATVAVTALRLSTS